MAHDCIDWAANPPTRKLPLLILTHGTHRVYTVVPKELKTLEDVARREFGLGDVEITFSSSCLNLCNGQPARITQDAWEHLSPYIGCATVEVAVPSQDPSRRRDSNARQVVSLNADQRDEDGEFDLGFGELESSARAVARSGQSAATDHGNEGDASAPADQHEEPWEEEVSAIPPLRVRHRRRVTSEDEDEPERGGEVPAAQVLPITSPMKSTQSSKETKKERDSGYRSQSDDPPLRLSKSIKQEKPERASRSYADDWHSQAPHAESQHETRIQVHGESSESRKLMIRVAHRPSQQESKFTTKSSTRVAKVLAAACKSFGLAADQASLFLIVSMEDEEGEEENLFPCDRNDTIARAGAEHDTESRFLLKIAGEP